MKRLAKAFCKLWELKHQEHHAEQHLRHVEAQQGWYVLAHAGCTSLHNCISLRLFWGSSSAGCTSLHGSLLLFRVTVRGPFATQSHGPQVEKARACRNHLATRNAYYA